MKTELKNELKNRTDKKTQNTKRRKVLNIIMTAHEKSIEYDFVAPLISCFKNRSFSEFYLTRVGWYAREIRV